MFRGVLASWAGAGQGGLSAQGLNRNESGLGLGSGLLESVEWPRRCPGGPAVPSDSRRSRVVAVHARRLTGRRRYATHIAHMPWAKTILLHRLFRST
jgi:hypothetical protein